MKKDVKDTKLIFVPKFLMTGLKVLGLTPHDLLESTGTELLIKGAGMSHYDAKVLDETYSLMNAVVNEYKIDVNKYSNLLPLLTDMNYASTSKDEDVRFIAGHRGIVVILYPEDVQFMILKDSEDMKIYLDKFITFAFNNLGDTEVFNLPLFKKFIALNKTKQ